MIMFCSSITEKKKKSKSLKFAQRQRSKRKEKRNGDQYFPVYNYMGRTDLIKAKVVTKVLCHWKCELLFLLKETWTISTEHKITLCFPSLACFEFAV